MDDHDSAENCAVTDNLLRPAETKPCDFEWVGFRYRLKWLFGNFATFQMHCFIVLPLF